MGAFTVSFLTIFYFTIAPGKIDWQLTLWDRGCSTKPKAVTVTKKKSQAEKKSGEESFNSGDKDYLVSKDGLAPLWWKGSKVVMLLINCLDPSNKTSVEWRQKGTSESLKVPCPAIIKKFDSHKNGVESTTNWKPIMKLITIKAPVFSMNFFRPYGFNCCQCPLQKES